MTKKIMFIFFAIILSASFCFAQETVTITTYYPAPYGIYQQLRLNPNGSPPACNGATAGLLHYDNGTGGIGAAGFYYCNGTSWQSVGAGYWAVNGTNINNTNPGNVGIGTTSPSRQLTLFSVASPTLRWDFSVGTWDLRANGAAGSALQFDLNGSPQVLINSSGWFGIGTNDPRTFLHVRDPNTGGSGPANRPTLLIEAQGNGSPNRSPRIGLVDIQMGGGTIDTAPAWFIDNYTDKFRIYRQSDIGQPSPNIALTVEQVGADSFVTIDSGLIVNSTLAAGNITMDTIVLPSTTSTFYAVYYAPASNKLWYNTSSKRYKKDIQQLKEDFSKILIVQPKSFKDKATNISEIGYIAEEFDKAGLKNLVIYDKDMQPESIKYDRIALYLLEVVKQQQKEIEDLRSIINTE